MNKTIHVVCMGAAQAFPVGAHTRPSLADVLNKAFEEGYMTRGSGSVGDRVWVELIRIEALQALYPGFSPPEVVEDKPAVAVVPDAAPEDKAG